MRKAGDIQKAMPETSAAVAADLIRRQNMAPVPQPGLVASEHIDLGSGQMGVINDGIPKSYIYRDGRKIEADGDKFANPLEGKPAGSKQLRDLTPTEFERYWDIYEGVNNRGTGNLAMLGM